MNRKKLKKALLNFGILSLSIFAGITEVSAQCSQWTTVADTFCSTDPAITLAGSPSPGVFFGAGVTGSTFTPGTAGAGTHVLGYRANSCSDTAFVTMIVQAQPNVTLTIPTTPINQRKVCEDVAPFIISGNSPNPGWPTGWFTGSGVDTLLGTFTPASTLIGWNVITYHYDNGVCSGEAVDSIEVLALPTPNISPAFPDLCETDPAIPLNQGFGTPTGGTETYSGTGVSGSQLSGYFFTPSTAGQGTHQITYCYTAPNGCESCVTQNINVYGVPNVSFNNIPPDSLCENGNPLNLSQYGFPTGGYFTGSGVQIDSLTLKPAKMGGPGSYTITYTFVDTNGCSDQATQTLTIQAKPALVITANTPASTPNPPTDPTNVTIKICEGDTAFTLINGGIITSLEPKINRDIIASDVHFYPMDDLTYQVVISQAGCKDTGAVIIDVIPPADALITGPPFICIGDTTTITASGATSYTWINPAGLTSPSITVNPIVTTLYQVVADSDVDGDGNQCSSDTGEINVVVNPLPLITTGRDTMLFYGDETLLRAYGGSSYVWSEGVNGELSCYDCNTPYAKPIFDRTQAPLRGYYVIGTDSNGCMNGDSIYITLNTRIVLFVPTAFSPNGDGVNDILTLETKGIESVEFEIFDRFGKTVFETNKLDEGWDGRFDGGDDVQKDVFIYRLKAIPYEKTVPPIDQAGEITLIR